MVQVIPLVPVDDGSSELINIYYKLKQNYREKDRNLENAGLGEEKSVTVD